MLIGRDGQHQPCEAVHTFSPTHFTFTASHVIIKLFPVQIILISFVSQATNQAGAGPYSELAWCCTPAVAPGAVTNLYLQDGFSSPTDTEPFCPSTCLALTWEVPNCNGQEISGYTLSLGEELIPVGGATCTVIRNLQPDTEYRWAWKWWRFCVSNLRVQCGFSMLPWRQCCQSLSCV